MLARRPLAARLARAGAAGAATCRPLPLPPRLPGLSLGLGFAAGRPGPGPGGRPEGTAGAVSSAASEAGAAVRPPRLAGPEIRRKFLEFYEGRGHARLPSASLVPEDPTVLLTIAGMLQFKPVFLGQVERAVPSATTSQKCIRTNDIENVGVTARHHTFFEMLGNFSFGDYFKEEAIRMAWELVTQVYGLPAERVWISVYRDDDEAYRIWRDGVGVAPERIVRLGDADNFWASGPTGPCGPCTELYYDFRPDLPAEGADLEDDGRFVEFYNLVFMESNRDAAGRLTPLENKNIDTGMGLERMAQILQGVPNNYETDLLLPLLETAAGLAGLDYHTAAPEVQTSLKVVGDHLRACVYLVSDGVTPSNVGRGYVVRRLLRRVVMKGRLLGIPGTISAPIAEVAIALSGGCDPEVARNRERVLKELVREEEAFVATLDRGELLLRDLLAAATASGAKVLAGADAFKLYDTYGFPLEITEELALEAGVAVDAAGFEAALEAARDLSRSSAKAVDLTGARSEGELAKDFPATVFTGYEDLRARSRVLCILENGEPVARAAAGSAVDVILDSTPFYGESGGQVGDRGTLAGAGGAVVAVEDVQKIAGGKIFLHKGTVTEGLLSAEEEVAAAVDAGLRHGAQQHHTATHLLQSALKEVLGEEVGQKGSLVRFDGLRFDFNNPKGLSDAQLAETEAFINAWIQQDQPVETAEMPIAEAKARGATAMFGEKYGETVRVVDVPGLGTRSGGLPTTMELCGGCHVAKTGDIGALKIVSESGVASGVRRIEAIAGQQALAYLNERDAIVSALAKEFKVPATEVVSKVRGLATELKAAQKALAEANKALAVAKSGALAAEAVELEGGARYLVATLEGADAASLSQAAQELVKTLGGACGVVLAAPQDNGKVSLVAACSQDAIAAGALAGKIIGAVAKKCGGGGGGKPYLATAGGKDVGALPDALAEARKLFAEQLSA